MFYDDFKSKSIQVAIGYGLQRHKVVLSKVIESILLIFASIFCIGILTLLTPVVLGLALNQAQVIELILSVIVEALRAVGYICISAIPVFYTQNAVNGTIVYVLLSSRTVMLLATMILGQELFVNMIGDMTKYFYTSQLYSIRSAFLQNGTWDISTMCAALSVYVVLPVVISVFSFEKKELKF